MIALDLMIVWPLACAALALVVGIGNPKSARWVGLAASAGQLALLVWLWSSKVTPDGRVLGLGGSQSMWSLLGDGLSLPLVALTALTGLLAVSASWNVEDRPGAHFALLAFLQAALAGVFLSADLILFYISWESVLVPMFLLIGGWGSADRRKASMKFLIYTFAGGAVLLVGVIYAATLGGSSSIADLAATLSRVPNPSVLFWLLAIGFLVKLPAVPVHTWLPDAHTEAPTAGSIVLAGVLLKMGGYGLIRIALPLAPAGFRAAAPALAFLGILGIVWGAAMALVQTDLKRLVAYSSVAHMGFVLLAISAGTPAALSAALVLMISHGFVAGVLFYLVGSLYQRAHTRELAAFGGLGAVTPRWAVAFVFASLASAGLPGLSGFPGEFVSVLESFTRFGWWTSVAAVGVVLAAAYSLRAVRFTVQGPTGRFDSLGDLDARETLSVGLAAIAILAIGIAPWIITAVSAPVTQALALLIQKGA